MNIERIALSRGYKVGLIVVAVFEIVLGCIAIGCSTGTIIITKDYYWSCYYYYHYYNPYPGYYPSDCYSSYYSWFFRFSVTAQGIWTGSMVIIAASLNIRFAIKPTKQTGSFSGGFSLFSFVLTLVMISLESMAVVDANYYYYNSSYANIYALWALHCSLLSLACVFFTLTMTNMIISYLATGCYGCCCYTKNRRTVTPLGVHNNLEHVIAYRPQVQGAQRTVVPGLGINYPPQQIETPHSGVLQHLGDHRRSFLTQSLPRAQSEVRSQSLIKEMPIEHQTEQTQFMTKNAFHSQGAGPLSVTQIIQPEQNAPSQPDQFQYAMADGPTRSSNLDVEQSSSMLQTGDLPSKVPLPSDENL